MGKEKEMKLLTIKNANPSLYRKVMDGEMSLHEAYNETKRIQLGLSEYRGANTRKREFSVDFKRIIQLHNPSMEELLAEIKKAYPLTWREFLKS